MTFYALALVTLLVGIGRYDNPAVPIVEIIPMLVIAGTFTAVGILLDRRKRVENERDIKSNYHRGLR